MARVCALLSRRQAAAPSAPQFERAQHLSNLPAVLPVCDPRSHHGAEEGRFKAQSVPGPPSAIHCQHVPPSFASPSHLAVAGDVLPPPRNVEDAGAASALEMPVMRVQSDARAG
jgi:hypothetical protein